MKAARLLLVILALALAAFAQETQTSNATDGHFTVATGEFQDYPFSVTNGVRHVRLSGGFSVTGGRRSLIIVLVMTDDQYSAWQRRQKVAGYYVALYNSDWAQNGTIDLNIPNQPANYHVVFDNREAPYAKAVTCDLQWRWENASQ